jgi:predicted O-methyltransferase YrrM
MTISNWAFRIRSALGYAWAARSRYFLHSPFVYDFYENVLREANPTRMEPVLAPIDALRASLLRDERPIQRLKTSPDGTLIPLDRQPVRRLAARESVPRNLGAFLYRFTQHYRPARILELGVNLGLSALYLQAGNPEANYTGIEGNPELATLAQNHIHQLTFNGKVIESSFINFLQNTEARPTYDLIYLDGDHRGEALLAYCHGLLPRLQAGGCLLIDDIRWNRDLYEAWQACCSLDAVSVSIELLRVGLLWVGREQAREHFVLWSPYGV